MAKQRFRLFNTMHGDHVAVLEMPEELLAPEAGILHHETMTLRGVKNGGIYTLIPVDDHTVMTLERIKVVYKTITEKPGRNFSTHIGRMDELVEIVGLLFGEISYTAVDSREELEKVINPNLDRDFEPRKVSYTILGDMLKNAKEAAGDTTPDEEEEKEHVHGPHCKH